jgi:hypothetical protein
MEQVVLLGDSLTQEGFKAGGWAARLADAYVRRADVLNRVSVGERASERATSLTPRRAEQGLSGYNSRWALDMLEGNRLSVDATRVRLATVFFGASTFARSTTPCGCLTS